jgi:hypothetical protein
MSCFDRADHVTTVAGVLAIFYLNDSSDLNRNKFRYIPVMLLFSLVYDLIWLIWLNDREKEGKATEKGLESSIISFSLYVSYVNMFFKVVVFFMLWKVSFNYLVDVKGIADAPRIIKLQKILDEFKPE